MDRGNLKTNQKNYTNINTGILVLHSSEHLSDHRLKTAGTNQETWKGVSCSSPTSSSSDEESNSLVLMASDC